EYGFTDLWNYNYCFILFKKIIKNYRLKNKIGVMMINNKFYKDTMLLIFSSAISQIILILSVPLISRIYTTSEFVNFTLFNNLALVFIPIINARFDLMIIKASSKKEANALSQISLKISFYIIAVILPLGLIISIIFSDYLFE